MAQNAAPSPSDLRAMRLALRVARRGLGNTWPNPAVGCILVKRGHIVARGWTQPGGRPHAEVHALAQAGAAAFGTTAYVTLEPCAHYAHTAPCTQALIRAGVSRVILGAQDPDPRVNGQGIRQLRQARVQVITGVLPAECAAANAGFFLKVQGARPLITLKLATSLDGRIATARGQSMWITGEAARAHGHLLRARHDAILIGIGTALADDPTLTCRLPGLGSRSPVRVVLDSALRLPVTGRLAQTAREVPTWVITSGADAGKRAALERDGVSVLPVDGDGAGRVALPAALAALSKRGITRLLVEGGAAVAASLVAARQIDALAHYQAPIILGGDGLAALAGCGVAELAQALRLRPVATRVLGPDRLSLYQAPAWQAAPLAPSAP